MARAVNEGAPSCINLILPFFVGGVCRLECEFRLNTSRHSGYPLPPHIVFLSFFATFKITHRMIKMLYLHILQADSTEKWNAFSN